MRNLSIISIVFFSAAMLLGTPGCTIFPFFSPKRASFPDSDKALYKITDAHLEQFSSAMRPAVNDPELNYRLGLFFQKRNKDDRAIEEFVKAIQADPDFIDAYNRAGISCDRLGRYEEAREYYGLALGINPNLGHVANNMGYSYFLEGKFEEAIQWLNRAVTLDPVDGRFSNNLAMAYLRVGKSARTLAELQKEVDSMDTMMAVAQDNRIHQKPTQTEPKTDTLENRTASVEKPLAYHSSSGGEGFTSREKKTKSADETGIETSEVVKEMPPPIEYISSIRMVEPTDASLSSPTGSMTIRPPENRMNENAVDLGFDIEISNGNGVRRMARRVGEFLKARGFRVTRLTNADHFGHAETLIYCPEDLFDSAQYIAERIPGLENRVHLIPAENSGRQVRVLIGKDLVPFDDILSGKTVVEISNGNGITGMAGRVGDYLKGRHTAAAVHLSNAGHFNFGNTVIYHSSGQRGNALFLAGEMPGSVSCALVESDQPGESLRILMGKDFVF